eukprot:gene16457-biopygen5263
MSGGGGGGRAFTRLLKMICFGFWSRPPFLKYFLFLEEKYFCPSPNKAVRQGPALAPPEGRGPCPKSVPAARPATSAASPKSLEAAAAARDLLTESPGTRFRRRWPVGVQGGPVRVQHVFGKIGFRSFQRGTCWKRDVLEEGRAGRGTCWKRDVLEEGRA